MPSDLTTPEEYRVAVTKAIFSHNNFSELSAVDFNHLSRFPNIKYVFFDHNRIDRIDGNAFAQVPQLKFIELSHNALKEISNAFYDDLVELKSLQFINLKRNPIGNYKNIDKLVAKGIQIDYDGVLGRERKIRLRSGSLVSDGSVKEDEETYPVEENLQLKVEEEEMDNGIKEEVAEHSEEDDDRNATRITDKPVKAFVVDQQMEQSSHTPTFKINNNFLGSIIFNFLAAFLVLVALPIAMVIYYFIHRRGAISWHRYASID